jgi:hypothetical protein
MQTDKDARVSEAVGVVSACCGAGGAARRKHGSCGDEPWRCDKARRCRGVRTRFQLSFAKASTADLAASTLPS